MDNSVTGNMDMLDSGYPRGVHDDVGHGREPGLSETFPCRCLQSYPGTRFFFCRRKCTTMLREKFSRGS